MLTVAGVDGRLHKSEPYVHNLRSHDTVHKKPAKRGKGGHLRPTLGSPRTLPEPPYRSCP
jgi:hypothetical protein